MDFQDLLAPLAGEFNVEDALAEWRWLVSGDFRPLVVSAVADLFVIAADESVWRLDTIAGTFARVAASVSDWERQVTVPEVLDDWFMPNFVQLLRETSVLAQGECYSATHPPVLGGSYEVENWRPVSWRFHFSHTGRMHEAIKDLPDGAVITKWNYTEL